jgi:hypothetical protein
MKSRLEYHRKYRRNKYATDPQYRESRSIASREYKTLHPEKDVQNRDARKSRILTHYGKDRKLVCCWEKCPVNDPDMLSLDHINNNGSADRKSKPAGDNFYRFLEKEGYPEGFQTLCMNHQLKKEILRRKELRAQKFRTSELNTTKTSDRTRSA